MKPKIQSTSFGSITIDGEKYNHDVLIRLDGEVRKRKKKLSKKVYGTSHVLSLAEAEHIYEPGAELLIIGSGQTGQVRLSSEAQDFFDTNHVRVVLAATPKAIRLWNEAGGSTIGLFHVTC